MTNVLGITSGVSGFAVPDIDAAKAFYGDTLGLEVSEPGMGLLSLTLPGGVTVMVYPKPDHAPAVFTILNFEVSDIDSAVDRLTANGVVFERYAAFDQDEKGIARSDNPEHGPSIAWFTDPAGNILAVMQSA
ncbi:VOC family protein [Glaciibacter superstes]|uniref:VOC family protein n=1 Tax=Glaciibacter superstes TaxID=501023 RepID=UPI0003B2F297|nr:VOC family protein [Glaciibacter superstes]